ncbi:bifunctional adenosylcobinamide kinase/adenosylcobinamide-phosphate guanylyltransferase [Tepidicella baoligensis]|uniref:bifunctional adenosylcobinamide kinase/adenosylcobinamide-phosphate guanylyltransferase n=1 Tax=Tepidicella baoligensis TaxID=2707016 RepID=UPI0015D9C6F8|nr:bifunctional adenosylcobinamide kinase/adenosylcobinamide-phosphate guanylyltransferase [Tepidicella baoligensis]
MVEAPRCEFILGGQKSGKSRLAEARARDWLSAHALHRAVLLATGWPGDDEMRERIQRHRRERAARVPGLVTVEEPRALADALRRESTPSTMVVVDCLTMWLTQAVMPPPGVPAVDDVPAVCEDLCRVLTELPGPVVLVGNEIGLGVIPLGAEVRRFVDALGWLNQQVARMAQRVTLMVAGCPLVIKEGRS